MSIQNSELTTNGSITKSVPVNKSMDYAFLREKGLELIRQYAGETWTDHNIHDPGITILEVLCYALTELGYKANNPIEDLLAGGEGAFNDFYKAVEILPSTPVTVKDYRKLLIDHHAIRNAWIELHTSSSEEPFYFNSNTKALSYNRGSLIKIQGLYNVLLEFSNQSLNTNILVTSVTTSEDNDYTLEVVFPYWDQLDSKNHLNLEIQSVLVKTVPGTGGTTGNPTQKLQEEKGAFFAVLEITYSDVGLTEDFGVHIRINKEMTENDRTELTEYVNATTPGSIVEILEDTTGGSLLKTFISQNNEAKNIIHDIRHFLKGTRNLCEDFYQFKTARTQEIGLNADIDVLLGTSVEEVLAEIFFAIDQFLSPYISFKSYEELVGKGYKTEEIYEGPLLQNGFLEDADLVAHERKDAETGEQLIYISDLFNLIKSLNNTGLFEEDENSIIDLRNLSLSNYINNQLVTGKARNCLKLTLSEMYKPRLSILKSDIRVFKEGEKTDFDMLKVQELVEQKKQDALAGMQTYPVDVLDIPAGTDRSVEQYYSLQNHFPPTYHIGEEGLPESAAKERKAQAKQLKSYLLFFEQAFVNFTAQLNHLKELFSFNTPVNRTYFSSLLEEIPGLSPLLNSEYPTAIAELTEQDESNGMLERRNRFLNHLAARFAENPKDFRLLFQQNYKEVFDKLITVKRKLLQNYPEISKNRFKAFHTLKLRADNSPDMWDTDNISGYEKRVCHLLGFSTCHRRHLYYPLTSYFEIYEEEDTDGIDESRFRLKNGEGSILLSSSTRYTDDNIMWAAIHEVIRYGINHERYEIITGTADKFYFNLLNPTGNIIARRIEPFDTETEIESAIQEVIDFIGYAVTGEGFHLIENMLLRPTIKGNTTGASHRFLPTRFYNDEQQIFEDPYSFQLTVIIPSGYERDFNLDEDTGKEVPGMERFRNSDFRRYMDRVIRNEAPAHILMRIFRLDADKAGLAGNTPSLNNMERVYRKWLELQASPGATNTVKRNSQRALVAVLYNIYNPVES